MRDLRGIQNERLYYLSYRIRAAFAKGNQVGLVVLATGFVKKSGWPHSTASALKPRVLFVALREEILRQPLKTFRRIRPKVTLGLCTGKEKVHKASR